MDSLNFKRLHELFDYDSTTGLFTRKISQGGQMPGTIAGKQRIDGYIDINISPKRYLAHRLAWFYVYGEWPKQMLDHKNGIRHDNRIQNLRQVTNSENQQNKKKVRSDSKSGLPCVYFSATHKKWASYITLNGKQKHLGYFETASEASLEYMKQKAIIHPSAIV